MSHPQGHPGMSEIYSLIFVSLSIKKLFQLQAIKPITLVDSIFLFPILTPSVILLILSFTSLLLVKIKKLKIMNCLNIFIWRVEPICFY